ncbi:hypothetical protein RN001_011177 [Aquatica leii]|uniref:Cytochrome P450 n=1 Tax=Aquatica leii TaxID=1421715 RepID=A0AAN7S8V0_9COLE|nr:hypothetical protein RN001_011177 [Aquatica leii]
MPVDPGLIKDVMVKDFHCFNDRGFYCNEKHDPLSAHLLNLNGDKWKKMRSKLTSAFTPLKVKSMFDTVLACTTQLLSGLEEYASGKMVFDADEVMARFTTDVISSCAFGFKSNWELKKYGDEIMRPPMIKIMLLVLAEMNQNLAKRLGVTRTTANARSFFLNVINRTIEHREKVGATRKDFLQILLDLKNEGQSLTTREITAQALLFFVAGFETSASTLTFCLYELAKHPAIQKRLREEIKNVLNTHTHVCYEAVAEMTYLNQVIEETLRKYPPAGVVARRCLDDYQVPESNLIIKRGTKVVISIQGLHHDPKYFPQPDVFDPERFNDRNRKTIKPYTYLPFGEGPRNCIGAKFGVMQTKIGLVTMLDKFTFSLNAKTPDVLKGYYGTISLTVPKTVWLEVQNL